MTPGQQLFDLLDAPKRPREDTFAARWDKLPADCKEQYESAALEIARRALRILPEVVEPPGEDGYPEPAL